MKKSRRSRIATQLRNRLGQTKHGPRITGVTIRQHATMGIKRLVSARPACAAG